MQLKEKRGKVKIKNVDGEHEGKNIFIKTDMFF